MACRTAYIMTGSLQEKRYASDDAISPTVSSNVLWTIQPWCSDSALRTVQNRCSCRRVFKKLSEVNSIRGVLLQCYQDAIKLSSHKSKPRLLGRLCKGLMLHLQATKSQDVTAQKARQGATAILNGKLCVVFLQNTLHTMVSVSNPLMVLAFYKS